MQRRDFQVAVLAGALALATSCSGSETPSGSGMPDATVFRGDTGHVDVDASRPDSSDTLMDASVAPDVPTADTGVMSNLRTLPDYRPCKQDEDCPVGLGSCVTTVPYNRVLPDGSRTATISVLFGLAAGQGVCSEACTNDPTACAPLSFNGLRPDPKPHVCQLVALGPSPYPDAAPAFPFADMLDPARLVAGQPFAAICRPPFELDPAVDDGLCSTCQDGQTACSGSALCYDLLLGQPAIDGAVGMCLGPCNAGICPKGFTCSGVANGAGSTDVCMPDLETCSNCLDIDADGKGAGRCGSDAAEPITEVDCDDRNPAARYDQANLFHPFPTFCGPHDYNCNGFSDDAEQIGSPDFGFVHCGACGDTCTGTITGFASRDCRSHTDDFGPEIVRGTCWPRCDDPSARADCNEDLSDGCEVEVTDPSRVYWLDADGDGFGDPDFATFTCSSTATPQGYAPSLAGADCNDDPSGGGAEDNPSAPERCDGRDNNCVLGIDESPFVDEGTTCPVAGLMGACAQGALVCNNGAPTCEQVVMPATEVCSADPDPSQYVDENCDGVVDNLTELCPLQTGACQGAVQRCGVTSFAGPVQFGAACTFPRIPAGGGSQPDSYALNNPGYGAEDCDDGIDNDCDGQADCLDSQCTNDAFCNNFCPTINATRNCPNQSGACAGTMQTCVANRWTACNYVANNTSYASNEIGEIACSDMVDNDCNNVGDCDDSQCNNTIWCANFCPVNGATRACPKTSGVCAGTLQMCTGNQWTECTDLDYMSNNSRYRPTESGADCDGFDNDCDRAIDEFCPVEGTAGLSVVGRHVLNPIDPNTGLAIGTNFGSGSGPSYNLFCPANFVMTKLHVHHNNNTAQNYVYRPAMRAVRVAITCGRPEIIRSPASSYTYVASTANAEVRVPTFGSPLFDTTVNGGPSYPNVRSGTYVGGWGHQGSLDDWAVFSVPWFLEFQNSTVDCDGDDVLRQFKIKASGWIDALGATCADTSVNPALPSNQLSLTGISMDTAGNVLEGFFGGVDAAPREVNAQCGAGEVMVGLRVQMENNASSTASPNREWVSEISFYCAELRLNLIADGGR